MRLAGKVAVVTGAAQGIGKAIAVQMANAGADVVIADVDTNLGEQTTQQINDAGTGKALFLQTDVSVKAQMDAAVDAAIAEFGKLDVMVNNAGIIIRDSVLETQPDDWSRVFAVNVNGTYHGTLAAGDLLRDAVAATIRDGVVTGDLGGDASTQQVAEAVQEQIHQLKGAVRL